MDDLPLRTGALRVAEGNWANEHDEREDAQKQWIEKSPEAYAMRVKWLRDMRYAYRDDPALMQRVNVRNQIVEQALSDSRELPLPASSRP